MSTMSQESGAQYFYCTLIGATNYKIPVYNN